LGSYLKKIPVPLEPTNFSIVDRETGEVTTDIYVGSKCIKPPTVYQTEDGRLLCKLRSKEEAYTKMTHAAIRHLKYALTPKECVVLQELGTYTRMYDCFIIMNDQFPTMKEMSKVLEVDYRDFRTMMKKYDALDLVHKTQYQGCTVYCVNPYLYLNGALVTEDSVKLFGNSIWATGEFKNIKKEQFREMLKLRGL